MGALVSLNTGTKRARRCGECSPCKRDDCGECVYCVDMKKFGGPGRKKKCCLKRRCNSQKVSNNPVVVDGKEYCHSTSKDHVFSEPKCLLEQGRKVYVTKGDGNCMFRAISYLMTDDEENYSRVRLLLQRFENLNKELFRGVFTSVNKPTIEEHVTHMGMPNTWGTHVELFATATYYQLQVYTYVVDDANLRWEVFKPLSDPKSLCYPVTADGESFTPSSHFELLYYPNSHYDSIVDYTTEKPSTTQPQLKSSGDNSVIKV